MTIELPDGSVLRSGPWTATPHLRMKMPQYGDLLSNFELQQLWISRSGEREWRSIQRVEYGASDEA